MENVLDNALIIGNNKKKKKKKKKKQWKQQQYREPYIKCGPIDNELNEQVENKLINCGQTGLFVGVYMCIIRRCY